MNILSLLKSSLRSLLLNKTRLVLTMLGVIIGVFAVVMMVALGQGVQNFITDEFEALGSNLLFVSPGSSDFTRDPAESLTRNKLDEKHIDLINKHASDLIDETVAYVTVGASTVYKNNDYFASIVGTGENAEDIFNYELTEGRFFNKSEVNSEAEVAVIGPLVKKELFGNNKAANKKIRIDGELFEVVGVFEEKGQNFDHQILIPYTTVQRIFEVENLSSIVAKAKNDEEIDLAIKQIEVALRRDLKEDDFSVLSQKDILGSIQSILGMLTLGIGAIAGISLLVGGIGIMNIMLVSVTERTREIGLRKAVGATPTNIATQFLIESILISVGGGMLGLTLGFLGSAIAQNWIRTEIPLWAIGLAFGFSVAVGVIFGTYPAMQAAKKDPIEALRYE